MKALIGFVIFAALLIGLFVLRNYEDAQQQQSLRAARELAISAAERSDLPPILPARHQPRPKPIPQVLPMPQGRQPE